MDLSIIIPARNEMFLNHTIQDIIKNKRGNTEIIAICDGGWPPKFPIEDHNDLTIIYNSVAVGQRAATNQGAKIASGKYFMKVDAHCCFDEGFDTKMMDLMEPDITMIPVMKNLHAFDWVCKNGHRRYQGPSGPCLECNEPTEMEVIFAPRKRTPISTAYRFDKDMHFQYWGDWGDKQKGNLTETMSIQGSCFMLTREKYFELDISSESDFYSWGQQGVEVACKTWMSGGRVMVNRTTWYAHLFRTQGGDFSFPYPQSGNEVDANRKRSKELFMRNKWKGATRSFEWIIEKFKPPEWEDYYVKDEEKTGEIIYYTCNTHKPEIEIACREQLKKSGVSILSVSLNKEIDFGDRRITIAGERGTEMMHRQIIAGLEASTADYVFLCESDVLYHSSHFNFVPKRNDTFYYNTNVWRMKYPEHFFVWTDDLQQVSGVCADRKLLLEFYHAKLEQIQNDGFDRHYEPGVRQSIKMDCRVENRLSEYPNICIRHDSNLTKSKWSPDDYRNKKFAKGFKEAKEVKGWENLSETL